MKTKEYIQKHNLDKKFLNKETSVEFINDLKSDFIEICDKLNVNDNLQKFDSAVKEMRTKWDAISNKSMKGLTEGLWKYFYATVISPVRDERIPSFAKMREEKAKRKAAWEAKQQAKAMMDMCMPD